MKVNVFLEGRLQVEIFLCKAVRRFDVQLHSQQFYQLKQGGGADVLSCKEEVWKGFLPVEFVLVPSDLTVHASPDPVHLMVSRFSYLSVVASEIIEYFQRCSIDFSTDIWFDYAGIPLRSELPIGVLFDIYLGRSKFKSPWRINIHFQAYPRVVLIHRHSSTAAEIEKIFFHSMKQALFLLCGSGRLFNELSVDSQQSIWKSVSTGSYSLQTSFINSILRFPKDQIKLLPIRLVTLVPTAVTTANGSLPVFTQQSSQGSEISISPSENHSLPLCLDQVVTLSQRPVHHTAVTAISNIMRDRTLREVLIEDFKQYDLNQLISDKTPHYTIQGMEISLDTPIYSLWCIMAHADMFLYINLNSNNKNNSI